MPGVFVTGTDTGVGKTYLARQLLQALVRRGRRAVGFKPVATGAEAAPDGLRNADAESLLAASSAGFRYADINPYVFEPATIPHVAAGAAGVRIRIDRLEAHYQALAARSDWVVVEGAGGWRVPLDAHATLADVARNLGVPVLLVVGVRLGCINHALLSAEAIRGDRCNLRAWIANEIAPDFDAQAAAIDAISERISKPPAARLRWNAPETNARQVAALAEFLLQGGV